MTLGTLSPVTYAELEINTMQEREQQCVNAIRALSMDAVQQANSGHPGMPLGVADMIYTVWMRFLHHVPSDVTWPNRDRFVLSAGHGSMALYSMLHLTGYDLSLDDIKQFRQYGSRTPGHPEYRLTPGVETTTGPLGQGIGNAVGMALAERVLASRFNRPNFPIVDHYTYVICSDGDFMEGVSYEVASLAGHLKLGKLIVLYDKNRISIDGSTDLSFTEDVGQRFESAGWHVQSIDGHARDGIEQAVAAAQAATDQPSLIVCHTHIGFGSPNRQDSAKSHGEPLGVEEVRLTKRALNWPEEPLFFVPGEVYEHMRQQNAYHLERYREWHDMMVRYREVYPDMAQMWDSMMDGGLPDNLESLMPVFEPSQKGIATRVASGQIINAIESALPGLIGGSADMHGSTGVTIKSSSPLQAGHYEGRNIYYGVREHGMAAIMNGLALHGGLLPFSGGFFTFVTYMKPSLRMAALMHLQVIHVCTHDSIGVGEDGPTHHPIEHLATLRALPNFYVVRPSDATETTIAWQMALERRNGPTAIILTRQAVPILDRSGTPYGRFGGLAPASEASRGAYTLYSAPEPQIILIATGSEVHLALGALSALEAQDIRVRVVSMPCWERFAEQPRAYRDAVLPPHITARVAIEAATPFGWERHVGAKGQIVAIDTFGVSAPGDQVYAHVGMTVERVVAVALETLSAQ